MRLSIETMLERPKGVRIGHFPGVKISELLKLVNINNPILNAALNVIIPKGQIICITIDANPKVDFQMVNFFEIT